MGDDYDYLCQIRDVFSNTVLASYQAASMKKELVLKTLKATQDRWHYLSQRSGESVHIGRRDETSGKLWLKKSFSRVGTPGDNAWSESFFSILKKEIVHWRLYPTRESARQAIFEYIEVFYNRCWVQKRLGYLSPIQFLNSWQQQTLQRCA